MAERANVTSIDAVEAFRASLIVYLGKARPAVEEASAEVLRMRMWLENDQRVFWEQEIRRRKRALEEAQQALFDSRLSNLREESAAEVQAVHRAKRGLEEAENKLKGLKQWNRHFESQVQPLLKQIEKMHTILTHDVPQAIAHLAQTVRTLEAYAETAPPSSEGGGSPAPAATPPPGTGDEKEGAL
jgi:hypothetical protein